MVDRGQAMRSSAAEMAEMCPLNLAHEAVELHELETLQRLIQSGEVDVNSEQGGTTLLLHAMELELLATELPGHRLHADTTALLLALGADPRRAFSDGAGPSAEQYAFAHGHWLALTLFAAWCEGH
jgi:hypothetical protein